MSSLFFPLLAGHLIADFWLQPSSWVKHKREFGWKSSRLLFHVLLASILPVLFTFRIDLWWFVPAIFASHYLIDILKSSFRNNIFTFVLDQLAHLAILWVLSFYWGGQDLGRIAADCWVYASGFILVTTPAGFLIGMFLQTVTKEKGQKDAVPMNASAWIGVFERILIVIFVITGQLQAIGFLVAAKSIFRFSDTQKENGTLKAEYFLLGTLVSFTVAIIVGLGVDVLR